MKKNKLENESKTNLLSRLIILKILLAIGQALKKNKMATVHVKICERSNFTGARKQMMIKNNLREDKFD